MFRVGGNSMTLCGKIYLMGLDKKSQPKGLNVLSKGVVAGFMRQSL